MGKRLTASEETQLLRDTIRLAHEATQALYDAIREARNLAPQLVAEFEATHEREMKQLSNHFTDESNRASHDLNAAIDNAREIIIKQIMAGRAVFDRRTSTVEIRFGQVSFDDQAELPYPEEPSWKEIK